MVMSMMKMTDMLASSTHIAPSASAAKATRTGTDAAAYRISIMIMVSHCTFHVEVGLIICHGHTSTIRCTELRRERKLPGVFGCGGSASSRSAMIAGFGVSIAGAKLTE